MDSALFGVAVPSSAKSAGAGPALRGTPDVLRPLESIDARRAAGRVRAWLKDIPDDAGATLTDDAARPDDEAELPGGLNALGVLQQPDLQPRRALPRALLPRPAPARPSDSASLRPRPAARAPPRQPRARSRTGCTCGTRSALRCVEPRGHACCCQQRCAPWLTGLGTPRRRQARASCGGTLLEALPSTQPASSPTKTASGTRRLRCVARDRLRADSLHWPCVVAGGWNASLSSTASSPAERVLPSSATSPRFAAAGSRCWQQQSSPHPPSPPINNAEQGVT